MKVTRTVLSSNEKKQLKRAFYFRLIFLGFIGLPLASILVILFLEENFMILAIVFLVILFLLYKYAFPFFIQSKNNRYETHKLVVETKVLNVEKQLRKQGFRFLIQTEFNTIDSWNLTLHNPTFTYDKLKNGMLLELHLLENNTFDLLEIKEI